MPNVSRGKTITLFYPRWEEGTTSVATFLSVTSKARGGVKAMI